MKKIRRTTITVVVLSPEEMNLGSYGLADLARELDDGACVGDHKVTQEEVLEGDEAVKAACEDVGSDESFFGDLDEDDGEDETQAERNKRTDLCAKCKVLHHDTCGMKKRGCSCCDDTRRQMAETV